MKKLAAAVPPSPKLQNWNFFAKVVKKLSFKKEKVRS